MKKWVSVEDHMPPADGCLRLLFRHGILTAMSLGERVGDEWWDDDEMILENVTHWMDLPDAPDQGGTDPEKPAVQP